MTDAKTQAGGESSGPRIQTDEVSGSDFGSGPKPQSSNADTQPANNFWGTVIPPGFLLAGRYRIDHFIARGGMGEVYAAYDCVLADRIALKTVTATASGDVEALGALRAEVTLSRKISHPNVCRMHDIGVHVAKDAPQLTFLTMEYVDGESLGSRLLREGPIPEKEATRLLSGILAGLQAAHEAGVLHRDLKSDNVMLRSRVNSEPTPVIMDFGLASALSPNSSRVSSDQAMVGSLAYMAPEQVQGDALRVVTDLYSVGVIFFEMLTGQLPFKASSPALAALKRLHEPAPRVRSIDPRIASELDRIVAKALQHRPQDRYPSARAMHQDLLEYLGSGEQPRVELMGVPSPRHETVRDSSDFSEDDTTLVSGKPPRVVRRSLPPETAPPSEDSSLPVMAATTPPARTARSRRLRAAAAFAVSGAAAVLLTLAMWFRRGEDTAPESSIPVTIGGTSVGRTTLDAVKLNDVKLNDVTFEAVTGSSHPVSVVPLPQVSTSAVSVAPTAPQLSPGAPPALPKRVHSPRSESSHSVHAAPAVSHASSATPASPSSAALPSAGSAPRTTTGGHPELVYPPGVTRPRVLPSGD